MKKMKYKHVLSSKATIKRKKYYEFDFTKEDIEKGMKATYNKIHLCDSQGSVSRFGLYTNEEGVLSVIMFHSFDLFEKVENKNKSKGKDGNE